MANNVIYFENPRTGQIKEAPVGFSWTALFFGFFPAIFRGNWKWAIIIFLISLITCSLSNLVFMVIYNKLYIKDIIADGFKVKSVKNGSIDRLSMLLGLPLPVLQD